MTLDIKKSVSLVIVLGSQIKFLYVIKSHGSLHCLLSGDEWHTYRDKPWLVLRLGCLKTLIAGSMLLVSCTCLHGLWVGAYWIFGSAGTRLGEVRQEGRW